MALAAWPWPDLSQMGPSKPLQLWTKPAGADGGESEHGALGLKSDPWGLDGAKI